MRWAVLFEVKPAAADRVVWNVAFPRVGHCRQELGGLRPGTTRNSQS